MTHRGSPEEIADPVQESEAIQPVLPLVRTVQSADDLSALLHDPLARSAGKDAPPPGLDAEDGGHAELGSLLLRSVQGKGTIDTRRRRGGGREIKEQNRKEKKRKLK